MSLYHEAAEILAASSSAAEGGSLKSIVFRHKKLKSSPNQLYALVYETYKWSPVLKEVIDQSELLKLERKLNPGLSLLLVHDLLLSKGGIALPQSHGLRASVERHKGRLASELTRARLRRHEPSLDSLRVKIDQAAAGEEANYPRWVRVNALKSDVEEQLSTTFANYTRTTSLEEIVSKTEKGVFVDPHVPNLLAVTTGTDLTKSEAYAAGKIILQDKASCFPAYLLDPQPEDGDVVDACAAPGNKTTHLAAILHQHQPEFASAKQTIFACEKDSRRAQILEKMVKIAGSKPVTRIGLGQDFLQLDPADARYARVGALLLDPSCSGSGIVGRDSLPDLYLPEAGGTPAKNGGEGNKRKRKRGDAQGASDIVLRDDDGNETVVKSEQDLEARLDALASFQFTLLKHAMRFPGAKKITYSTCSIHKQENEQVVMDALASDVARKGGWRIMRRDEQVRGMREWPVRGELDCCDGDTELAEACIRSYKGDGRGVMGFFVAGFVRGTTDDRGQQSQVAADGEDDQGPYQRDENGVIIRDVLGMPVVKSSGQPVQLAVREEAREESSHEEEEEEEDSDSDSDSDSVGSTDNEASSNESDDPEVGQRRAKRQKPLTQVEQGGDDEDEDEWTGFGD